MNKHDLVLLSRLRTVSRGEEVTGCALQVADLSLEMRRQLVRLASRISVRSRQHGRALPAPDVLEELLEATRCRGWLPPEDPWCKPAAVDDSGAGRRAEGQGAR